MPNSGNSPRQRFERDVVAILDRATGITWSVVPDRLIACAVIETPQSNTVERVKFHVAYSAEESGIGPSGWYLSTTVIFWNTHSVTEYRCLKNVEAEVKLMVEGVQLGLDLVGEMDQGRYASVPDTEETNMSESAVKTKIANMKNLASRHGRRIIEVAEQAADAALEPRVSVGSLDGPSMLVEEQEEALVTC